MPSQEHENRSDVSKLTLLGQSGSQAQKNLETFPKPTARHEVMQEVTFQTEEFTSMCPLTGQPDYGRVEFSYIARDLCLESKSYKLYLMTFRNEGHFYEALASIILDDLVDALDPYKLVIKVHQAARGGISLVATVAYEAEDFNDISALVRRLGGR